MKSESYYYCTKCGHVVYDWIDGSGKCFYCGSAMEHPENYVLPVKNKTIAPKMIFDEFIKGNPNFDQKLYDDRITMEQRFASQLRKNQGKISIDYAAVDKTEEEIKKQTTGRRHTCPMCGSTNIKSTALNNLFSKKKIDGKYVCSNCRFVW